MILGASAIWISPIAPIAKNQTMQTGPNSFETAAVPRDWMANSAIRMTRLICRICS